MVKRVLTIGITYTGDAIEGVEIETRGLCRAEIEPDAAAFALYDYDVIIINPQTYSQFLFGKPGPDAAAEHELYAMKKRKDAHDLDTLFDRLDRMKELEAAFEAGAQIVWCLAPERRQNFFGYRATHEAYLSYGLEKAVEQGRMTFKRSRKLTVVDGEVPFRGYFDVLANDGWTYCLTRPVKGIAPFSSTPEGYTIGASVALEDASGWLLTPPPTENAANQLVRDAAALGAGAGRPKKYHSIFLSHTGADKAFVRKLKEDLEERGVEEVWLDEAEIQLGESLTEKISEGIKKSRFIAVVLSKKSVEAPWVKKELDIAINGEIGSGKVSVLPLLYEECDLPEFLKGKLYADFTDADGYAEGLEKLIRRLQIS